MKIIITDGDEYPLINEMDCIEPFSLTDFGGEYKIEVYPRIRGLADEFTARFGTDFFSDEPRLWLSGHMKGYLDEWGYTEWTEETYTHSFVYVFDADMKPDRTLILPETRLLDPERDDKINITGQFISGKMWDGDDYAYTAFGSIADGKLVSVAAENSHWREDDETEIGITTANLYRKRGFAVSNLTALCEYKLSRGIKRIFYSCASDNIASIKTAEAAGFRLLGRQFILTTRRKD